MGLLIAIVLSVVVMYPLTHIVAMIVFILDTERFREFVWDHYGCRI
jgi:hypothetical protein